jgi:hypothetical protein
MKTQPDSFISYAIANFFDTFLVFWLSFLTVGLFNFVDQLPTNADIPLPDMWMFIYEHIFMFSQWFIPILLGIFVVNAFLQGFLLSRMTQKVIHAWILDSIAIIAGAMLGSIYLGQGELFFLNIAIPGGPFFITLFSFGVYFVSILGVSIVTYIVMRFTRPKQPPLDVLNEAPNETAATGNV